MFVTCDGIDYKSMNYHHALITANPKSQWKASREDECHTFCVAHLLDWQDERGNYWAVAKDAEDDLGKDKERLAFFRLPTNLAADPWHGFPVSWVYGLKWNGRLPSESLLERWEREEQISFTTARRIRRRRI